MNMIVQGGRSIPRLRQSNLQCAARPRALVSTTHIERVPTLYTLRSSINNTFDALNNPFATSSQSRFYATRPVSRPKQHTGRDTSKRKVPTTSATKAAKVPAKTKTAPKSIPKTKSKPRPKSKPKTKVKIKAKPKPKPKAKVRALTQEQLARKAERIRRAKVKELKEIALKPPSGGQKTAWMVFNAEMQKGKRGGGTGRLADAAREASIQFRQLEPEQLEHYNHVANRNREQATQAYRTFIQSHSALRIHEANNARNQLKRIDASGNKKHAAKWLHLQDERQVKGNVGSYAYFVQARQASRDFKGLTLATSAGLISREWKALTEAEKKEYDDRASADKERYRQELKTVLGKDMQQRKASSST